MKLSHTELADVLGKTLSSPGMTAFLKKISPRKSPKLALFGREYSREVFFDLPKLGLVLDFSLPSNKKATKANEKYLKLVRVKFWKRHPKMGMPHSFVGELPCGITFSDTEKDVRKKVGKPTKTARDFQSRHFYWEKNTPKLFVYFAKNSEKANFKLTFLSYDL